jgi:hypothetical protein
MGEFEIASKMLHKGFKQQIDKEDTDFHPPSSIYPNQQIPR